MAPPAIPKTLHVLSSVFMSLLLLFLLSSSSLLFLLSSSSATTSSACYAPDRASLLSFARDVGFDVASTNSSYSWQGDDCCSWRGITCSTASVPPNIGGTRNTTTSSTVLRVTELALRFANTVSLSIPAGLCNLSALARIHLDYADAIKGDLLIPDCVGNHLPHLSHLFLSMPYNYQNYIIIPVSFTNLQNLRLRGLRVDSQSLHSLLRPSKLAFISLDQCPLPHNSLPIFTSLPNLTNLYLSRCLLSGPIPSFNNTPALSYFSASGNSLSGPIPSFNNTPLLTYLNLSHNSLTSDLEKFALHSTLPALSYFSASGNSLSGPIPTFTSLPNLAHLHLSRCSLSGPIPSFNNTLLRDLDLYFNRFTSDLESFVLHSNLPALSYFSAEDNDLSGSLPAFPGQRFPKLERISFSSNRLSGSVDFSNLRSLSHLHIDRNRLSGPFPALNAPNLQELDLSGNRFNSVLPQDWQYLSNLKFLDLAGNSIAIRGSRRLPDWLFRFPLSYLGLASTGLQNRDLWCQGILSLLNLKLDTLDLSRNRLTGPGIFKCLALYNISSAPPLSIDLSSNPLAFDFSTVYDQRFSPLYSLSLSNCSLYGPLNFEYLLIETLEILDLSHNMLTGKISTRAAFALSRLAVVLLNNNSLVGSIPHELGSGSSLFILRLNDNRLVGDIPPSILNLTSLAFLDLSNNQLQGDFNTLFSSIDHQIRLSFLSLNDNRLVGGIPPSILNLTSLVFLDLSNNQLQGDFNTLFSSIDHQIGLGALLLSNNSITGSIPPSSGAFAPKLQILDLSSNKITGSIPPSLGAFAPNLQILDLSSNKLYGMIPWNLSTSAFLRVSSNATIEARLRASFDLDEAVRIYVKGIPAHISFEPDGFTLLDLSNNHLTGAIPPEFGDLVGLRNLNLSRNMLSGSIPATLSKMSLLEGMDLSFNQLEGQIPSTFSTMHSLGFFDVSYNKALEGPIPMGTLFLNTSFKGDPGLCGQPILKACNNGSIPASSRKEDNHKHTLSTWIRKWIALPGLCLGMVVGFVGTMLALHAKPSPLVISKVLCYKLFGRNVA